VCELTFDSTNWYVMTRNDRMRRCKAFDSYMIACTVSMFLHTTCAWQGHPARGVHVAPLPGPKPDPPNMIPSTLEPSSTSTSDDYQSSHIQVLYQVDAPTGGSREAMCTGMDGDMQCPRDIGAASPGTRQGSGLSTMVLTPAGSVSVHCRLGRPPLRHFRWRQVRLHGPGLLLPVQVSRRAVCRHHVPRAVRLEEPADVDRESCTRFAYVKYKNSFYQAYMNDSDINDNNVVRARQHCSVRGVARPRAPA
jgi:hypothetical protein